MSRQQCTRTAAFALTSAALTVTLIAPAGPASAAALAAASSAPSVATGTASATGAAGRHRALAPVSLPNGFRPEGIASGPGDTYYAGSMVDGRIWTGDLSRGTGRQLTAGVTGRALRGMQWDPRSGLLWVTGQDAAPAGSTTPTGIVLAVDARTGAVVERFVVPGAAFLNDLVVTRKAVWVTDSRVDTLTRIGLDRHARPSGGIGQVPLTGPWPVPDPAGNRANGIRALSDGTLVLDHSTAGGLWQVDPRTGAVQAIPVTGVPEGSPGLTGGDGLERRGNTLYVVRGSGQQEVTVLKLRHRHGEWSAHWAGVLTSDALDVPSTATLVGHTLWAVNARFGVADPATAPYQIVPLPVR